MTSEAFHEILKTMTPEEKKARNQGSLLAMAEWMLRDIASVPPRRTIEEDADDKSIMRALAKRGYEEIKEWRNGK